MIYNKHTEEKKYLAENKQTLSKEEKSAVKKKFKNHRRLMLWLFLLFNLGGLMVFKFYNMTANAVSALPQLNLIMPVGISFYTLQIIGYVMDVYNKKSVPEKNMLKTMLFTMWFPQVIQGPIARYDSLAPQLFGQHSFNYDNFVLALLRMLWGYFKKLVIADRFVVIVTTLFTNYTQYAGFEVLIGALLYTIQLYADFSGGIDIAIGASELFGVILPENFQRPFFSKSISEFWRRWHITLGGFLRDYIFYPVTLSKPLSKIGKFFAKRKLKWMSRWIPAYISLFILWFCSGVWHGEGAQYILYGMYHGGLIMLGMTFEPYFITLCEKVRINRASQTFKIFQVARTFLLVTVGEIIFRAPNIPQALYMIKSMFATFNPWVLFDGFVFTLGLDAPDFLVGVVAIIVLLTVSLLNRKQSMRHWVYRQELPIRWAICLAAIMAIVIFGVYGPGYDPAPFIYFQF
ncbi:MAG: MBOAT family protein [Oscillospiraceae bacterium]|nr:MBOAT family protein [Oscillospiraceae bacterium]